MYNEQVINRIAQKQIEVKNRIANIKHNFEHDFVPRVKQYEISPINRMILEEVDYHLANFIRVNDLKIRVSVLKYEDNILFYCPDLESTLIWEAIQPERAPNFRGRSFLFKVQF